MVQPKQVLVARVVFSELVEVLRRKVAFPLAGSWVVKRLGFFFVLVFLFFFDAYCDVPDRVEKFQVWVFILFYLLSFYQSLLMMNGPLFFRYRRDVGHTLLNA